MSNKSSGTTYTRVNADWHRLETSHGLFFGYTRKEVLGKANFARIAHEEQQEFLAMSDRQRGARA